MRKSLFLCCFFLLSCAHESAIIDKSKMEIKDGILTPEVLWSFGRLGDVSVAQDGTRLVYGVTYFDVKENKSNRELYVLNLKEGKNTKITTTSENEYAAKWVKNGSKIAFLAPNKGTMQIWEMNPDGSDRKCISDIENGVSDFLYSPNGTQILFIADVKYGTTIHDKYPDLDKSTGIIVDDLMYKHWDEWVTSVPHPFLADFDGEHLSSIKDLLVGEPYECPMKPFGGIEQLSFSPDGKYIAYTCRKKTGLSYSISTDSDIFLYDIENQTTINLCKTTNSTDKNEGYDVNPAFSPDGNSVAWLSMEHDGYESDKNRLYVMNLKTGEKRDCTKTFDQSIGSFVWSNDGQELFFTSCWHGTIQIYSLKFADDSIEQLTEGQHDYESVTDAGNVLIGVRHSMSIPNEIYAIDKKTGEQKQLSFENQHLLSQLKMGKVEERWVETSDNKQMLVWVVYPPDFDATKKYPTLLYCQGGPQSPVSQFWSYRWNLQIMAANGYIVVAPNRRGLDGFGSEWNAAISGDYGGQCMSDLLTAIDELSKEPFVDEERLGCVGASFGGFSVYWLAGHHEKRFKAFIAHDGIFNMEQQYLETEEMWFANWDMGGAYWEKDNETARRTFNNSPHRFVDKWDTPILCIHGEKDYRILASQGMSAFNAAKLRGIPAELLIFPDENHWVLQPQNGVLWQRTFFEWLDKWLKK